MICAGIKQVVLSLFALKPGIRKHQVTNSNLIVTWWSIFVLVIKLAGTTHFDYCKISKVHTMCVFKAISKNCIQYRTQNEIVVRRMVNDHNLARSKFAGGRKGFFVPNMMKMYWDQELADLSARWACQCKGSLDEDRGVRRFEVGQVVWTVMDRQNFTEWSKIWKFIIKGGTGFYKRDNWGRMITNYNPSDPLSMIYNPYVRFMGCTLAKYRIWSMEVSSFAFTTTLVCNYGPVEESYEKYAKEDWPCRGCPKENPCSTKFYMRGNILPPNLPNERNLCIDPKFEYQHPQPGKRCPVDDLDKRIRLAGRQLHGDATNLPTLPPLVDDYGEETSLSQELRPPMLPDISSKHGSPINDEYKIRSSEKVSTDAAPYTTGVGRNASTSAVDLSEIVHSYDYEVVSPTENPTTKKNHKISRISEINKSTKNPKYKKSKSKSKKSKAKKKPVTTKEPFTAEEPKTTEKQHIAVNKQRHPDYLGNHDPSEEDYDYHGPVDADGHINYCEVFCSPESVHTLCKYTGVSPECKSFVNLGNNMVKDDLLKMHNEYRDKFAEGTVGPPHPLASNLVCLRWSEELEKTANMWLKQCQLKNDECRDSPLKDPASRVLKQFRVSQNIGWEEYNTNSTYPSHRDLFKKWTDESANFTYKSLDDFLLYEEEGRPRVENFVQVIWARTHYVGCAYGTFAMSDTKGIAFLVCNYAPLGKEVSKHIYIPGGPCSNCYTETDFRQGRCFMRDYPNLCDSGSRLQPFAIAAFAVTYWLTMKSAT
ncbi:hypothetical protein GE061_012563 [Apolygus lucorum]|uniref:SCP domain-containing protein n=1 Tax=Apolygus lucorum TaxID=248454 RepID=A0A8S9XWQ9_APOLU|nr:hypothetical protein GE061_012563 [Apolygus lucorum]